MLSQKSPDLAWNLVFHGHKWMVIMPGLALDFGVVGTNLGPGSQRPYSVKSPQNNGHSCH